jgi:hypothetical protein
MNTAAEQAKDKNLVERIADAVLYEGYILYPYRRSSVKNQQRWNFGALCPESYAVAQHGTERSTMLTECLLEADESTTIAVKVRFLHLMLRDTWQEAIEREVVLNRLNISKIHPSYRQPFDFPATCETQQPINGEVEISTTKLDAQLFKLSITIRNLTAFNNADNCSRDDALMHSFVSTHTIIETRHGAFVSLLDPPDNYKAAAAECVNNGTFPVLAGDEGTRNCILSSPIILYDYPQIAPESAGNLFDGTEIDEILTLRIMSLTDEEKDEMRQADELARQLLERTESLTPEQLLNLHGLMKKV